MTFSASATNGARAIGSTRRAQALGDAVRAFGLMWSSDDIVQSALARSSHADSFDAVSLHGDPVSAARAWLADPRRQSELSSDVIECASRSLDVAAIHYQEFNMLADEVATDGFAVGNVDELRLARLDSLAGTMRTYSEQLRALLDDAPEDPDGVAARLESALDAAADGGLVAFVRAL